MVLLVGIGNPLRRDDGAGPALAAVLAPLLELTLQRPARVLAVQQLAPEHAVEIAGAGVEAVLVCDASLREPGRAAFHWARLDPWADDGARLTHELTPVALMAYATLLLPAGAGLPPAWIVTAAAHDLGHGEGLSAETEAALASVRAEGGRLVQEIAAVLGSTWSSHGQPGQDSPDTAPQPA